ncbi:sugar ABC transporter ATP-binding protein [Ruminiclostridium sufflavum]
MDNITKTFPGVRALDDVKLYIKPGSVHALIGENGAGKSTLMKCLFGIYKQEGGTIEIDGEPIRISDTQSALKSGISMIHQELNPIPNRTVADNIWVGRYIKNKLIVNEKLMEKKTQELLKELDFDISPKVMARELSVSQLQAMEIAKAVSYNAKIIIMDEPTSSLTIAETKHLFRIIRQMRDEGRSIIYISHKLEEMFEIADEVTVMRDGKYIGTWEISKITIDHVIEQMVGRSMEERFPKSEQAPLPEVMLKVENITSPNPRSFKDISFDLHKGEILGIGGLVGAQRTEMVESLFGLRPIASGVLYKEGKLVSNKTPLQAIENGFALLTEERRATGIVPMLSVNDNTLIASYKKFTNWCPGVINKRKSTKSAAAVCKSMNVKTPRMSAEIQNLSGGNQQKVLVGRWLLTDSNILILDEPTRGVDVGAKYEIYKIIRELARKGNSIIMVSSEMPELLGMSDRILVMCDGHITGILKSEEASQVEIMRLATRFTVESTAMEAEK